MGHELYYETGDRHIGSMSLRRWDEVRKLLPLLVDYINCAMTKKWRPGMARDVCILQGGMVVPAVPPPDSEVPDATSFELDKMISTEHADLNEIYFYLAPDWKRLFAWCEFLEQRDGTYGLYAPLVQTLRRALSEILAAS